MKGIRQLSPEELRPIQTYAQQMGVNVNTVRISGGLDKLQSLTSEVQRLLLGKSEKFLAAKKKGAA